MQDPVTRRKRFFGLSGIVVVALAATLAYSSCGESEFNLFQPVAEPMAMQSDKKAQLEQVKVLLDKKEYEEALEVVEPIVDDEKTDSNEARLLYGAAKLGVAELDVWSIISSILDATSNDRQGGSNAGGGGLDDVIDALGEDVLGTGEERQGKIEALVDALTTLRNAPYPDDRKIQNTGCLFAAFLAVPTLAEATEAMNATTAALSQISAAASSGGTVCPNVSLLDSAAAGVLAAASNFNLVLQAATNCPFLDLEQTASAMNQLETTLENLKFNTDRGCDSLPTCPASMPNCAQLFPTCVQQALAVGTSSAAANDGVLSSCEIILNCTDPAACFN